MFLGRGQVCEMFAAEDGAEEGALDRTRAVAVADVGEGAVDGVDGNKEGIVAAALDAQGGQGEGGVGEGGAGGAEGVEGVADVGREEEPRGSGRGGVE